MRVAAIIPVDNLSRLSGRYSAPATSISGVLDHHGAGGSGQRADCAIAGDSDRGITDDLAPRPWVAAPDAGAFGFCHCGGDCSAVGHIGQSGNRRGVSGYSHQGRFSGQGSIRAGIAWRAAGNISGFACHSAVARLFAIAACAFELAADSGQ